MSQNQSETGAVLRRSTRENASAQKCKDCNDFVEIPNFIWVQCDSCQKWRKIDKQMEDKLDDMWYCHMNPLYQSCDLPEEEWRSPASGWIYTYQGFLVGQLVWAKMNSYPPWPGIISPDPWCSNTYVSPEVGGLLYHVEFLGRTRSHSWLPEENVQSYQENCSLEGRKSNPGRDFKHNKKLQSAIAEAEKLVAMSNEERLALCHYTEKEKERLENTQKRGIKKNRQKTSTQRTMKTENKDQSRLLPTKTCSESYRETNAKLQQLPAESSCTTDLSNPFAVATLLKLIQVPLLNGLLLNNTTPLGAVAAKSAETQQKLMTVAEKLTSKTHSLNTIVPKRKRGRPCKSGRVTKKKKSPTVTSQSILRYFGLQENSKKVPVNDKSSVIDLTDQIVPESIETLSNLTSETLNSNMESLRDLEKDIEMDMLNIEGMLSQFDTTDKISDLDYSDIAENEMSQIEELLSSFQDQ